MSTSRRASLSRKELIAWLRLIRSENVGPVTFHQLMTRYGDAESALADLPELAKRGGRARPIRIATKAAAERELAALAEVGGEVLAIGTEGYPPALAAIADPPPLLLVRGHPELLTRPAVAIVGARNGSANGLAMAGQIARDLGRQGLLVVSGMARGIDSAVHKGSLESGTAAVLAGGLDVPFPPQNENLYAEIAARGVLVSEMPMGTRPMGRHFPRRNRLISGLSLAVAVIEAAPGSGSTITAQCALDQGRELFAVPGHPWDSRAEGCNKLLKDGAHFLASADDILSVLADQLRAEPEEAAAMTYELDAIGPAPVEHDDRELERGRQEIPELLGFSPVAVDEVIRGCQFSPSVVATVLLELELAGRVSREPGNRVALTQLNVAEA